MIDHPVIFRNSPVREEFGLEPVNKSLHYVMQVQPPNLKVKCPESTDKMAIEDKYIQRSGGSSLYEEIYAALHQFI